MSGWMIWSMAVAGVLVLVCVFLLIQDTYAMGEPAGAVGVAMAQLRAQHAIMDSDIAFHEKQLDPIRFINPEKATEQELEDAIDCCKFYWSYAYPETENDLVEWVYSHCKEELSARRKAEGSDW